MVSGILYTTGFLLIGIAPSPYLAYFAFFVLLPFGTTVGFPVTKVAVLAYCSKETQSLAISLEMLIGYSSGVMLGILIQILMTIIPDGNLLYRSVLGAQALLTVCVIFLTFGFRETDYEKEVSEKSLLELMKTTIYYKSFYRFCGLTLLMYIQKTSIRYIEIVMPFYLKHLYGNEDLMPTYLIINAATITLSLLLFASLAYTFKPYTLLIIGGFVMGLAPIPMMINESFASCVIQTAIGGMGHGIWIPRIVDYTNSVAPKGHANAFMSIGTTGFYASMVIAGSFSGELMDSYCLHSTSCTEMWGIVIGFAMIAPVLLIVLMPIIKQPEHEENPYIFRTKHSQTEPFLTKETSELTRGESTLAIN
jgi:MFS family permease